jgi:hypothetical protein
VIVGQRLHGPLADRIDLVSSVVGNTLTIEDDGIGLREDMTRGASRTRCELSPGDRISVGHEWPVIRSWR